MLEAKRKFAEELEQFSLKRRFLLHALGVVLHACQFSRVRVTLVAFHEIALCMSFEITILRCSIITPCTLETSVFVMY